jgi:hypothetical protein
MKIKREEELIDFLAARKQRRKRELISFRQDLGSNRLLKNPLPSCFGFDS